MKGAKGRYADVKNALRVKTIQDDVNVADQADTATGGRFVIQDKRLCATAKGCSGKSA